MTAIGVVWGIIGAATGAWHARSLWRGVQRRHAIGGAVSRFAVTAVVLTAAALRSALLPSATGWAVGMVVASLVLYGRFRR